MSAIFVFLLFFLSLSLYLPLPLLTDLRLSRILPHDTHCTVGLLGFFCGWEKRVEPCGVDDDSRTNTPARKLNISSPSLSSPRCSVYTYTFFFGMRSAWDWKKWKNYAEAHSVLSWKRLKQDEFFVAWKSFYFLSRISATEWSCENRKIFGERKWEKSRVQIGKLINFLRKIHATKFG